MIPLWFAVGFVLLVSIIVFHFMLETSAEIEGYEKWGVRGPRLVPMIGQSASLQRYRKNGKPMQFFSDLEKEFDRGRGAYFYCIGPQVILSVTDPELIKSVLRDFRHCYVKSSELFKNSLRPLLGNGVLMSEGEVWKRQRKLMAPTFHFDSLRRSLRLIQDSADEMTRRLLTSLAQNPDEPLDLLRAVSSSTMDIIFRCTLSLSSHDALYKELEGCFDVALWDLQERAISGISILPVLKDLPIANRSRMLCNCKHIQSVVLELTRKRTDEHRRNERTTDDLLDLLLIGRPLGASEELWERQIVDEIVTFVFAAYETTASAFGWLLFHLARPEGASVWEACVAEISDESLAKPLGYEDLGRLSYVEAVVRESLRLSPPAPLVSKYCTKTHVIGEGDRKILIPKGAVVQINSWSVHRNPVHWRDPARFWPERWLKKQGRVHHPFSYLAFSQGHRSCMGKPFAMLEMKALLISLCSAFPRGLTFVPDRLPVADLVLNVRFVDGLYLKPRGGVEGKIPSCLYETGPGELMRVLYLVPSASSWGFQQSAQLRVCRLLCVYVFKTAFRNVCIGCVSEPGGSLGVRVQMGASFFSLFRYPRIVWIFVIPYFVGRESDLAFSRANLAKEKNVLCMAKALMRWSRDDVRGSD